MRVKAARDSSHAYLGGSPGENGHCDWFDGKFRDELVNREILHTLRETQILIERWCCEYNEFQ